MVYGRCKKGKKNMKECKYCADVDTEILYGEPQKILGEVFGAGIFISESKPRTLHCFV